MDGGTSSTNVTPALPLLQNSNAQGLSLAPPAPKLETAKHIKYYTRCLRSILPAAYTAGDSTKLSLAFFTVSGLDLLKALPGKDSAEKAGWIDWVYSHLLPGSRGFVGTLTFEATRKARTGNSSGEAADVVGQEESAGDAVGVGGVSVSLFALLILVILGDDLSRIDRKGMMHWLISQQTENGGFWDFAPLEIPGDADRSIPSGRNRKRRRTGPIDCRFCYCAMGVRYLIRGWETGVDVDVDGMVEFLGNCFTYDGGFSETQGKEAHAGYTYCALAALSLVNRLPPSIPNMLYPNIPPTGTPPAQLDLELLTHWLVSRQLAPVDVIPEGDDDDEDEEGIGEDTILSVPEEERRRAALSESCWRAPDGRAGFQGRTGKRPDTCYSFWIGGSLEIIGRGHLKNKEMDEAWLLAETQHLIGGFGKTKGDLPDLLHSYFGLAALSLSSTENSAEHSSETKEDTEQLEPTLCISMRAKKAHDFLSFKS